jgi:hypothetical protein
MRPRPPSANAQIPTDIVYVGWVVLCVWLALTLHRSLSDLAEPG